MRPKGSEQHVAEQVCKTGRHCTTSARSANDILSGADAAKTLILSYGRRSTDEKGVPLPDVTTLPDGTKVALNQLASFTHTFAVEWRLTEAGWRIAAAESQGATAIL